MNNVEIYHEKKLGHSVNNHHEQLIIINVSVINTLVGTRVFT